jgi:hypothetical protein
MRNQIFKTSIVVLLLSVACKQDKFISQNISKRQVTQLSEDTILSNLNNKEYSLKIETHFTNDTLNVVDYKEDKYSSPVITYQKLIFFHKNELIKEYIPSIRIVEKKTIMNKNIRALETPIYKMCLSNNFYIIQGSDYCNGSDCPEFLGIYSVNGDIIHEGFPNEKKTTILKTITIKNNIDLNKSTDCVNVNVFN